MSDTESNCAGGWSLEVVRSPIVGKRKGVKLDEDGLFGVRIVFAARQGEGRRVRKAVSEREDANKSGTLGSGLSPGLPE